MTGRFNEADIQYEKALSLRPNHPQLNYFHGVVLEKLGKRKVKGKMILSLSGPTVFCFFAPFRPRVQNGGKNIVFVIGRDKGFERINMAQKNSQNVSLASSNRAYWVEILPQNCISHISSLAASDFLWSLLLLGFVIALGINFSYLSGKLFFLTIESRRKVR